MPRLGVLGWPVRHSRSPAMHNAALRALGLDAAGWRYQHLPVPPDVFHETVRALPGSGFAGANVTIPHKEAALELATEATERARAIGAANTLTFTEDGGIHADNTDAPGVLEAIGRPVDGARALVLGAGGSARAVVWALRAHGAEVEIWNRTPERAQRLARDLGGAPVRTPGAFDVLVNCTAIGLRAGEDEVAGLKNLPVAADALGAGTLVVDLVYRAGGTALLAAAHAAGADVVDGLDILVAQGAHALERWTGGTAPRAVMRAAAEH